MSKSYHMPGWRIAYAAGNSRMIDALAHLKTYTDYGTFMPVQYAAAWALDHADETVGAIRELYRGRAHALVTALRDAGWTNIESPGGTMFVWAPIPEALLGLDSFQVTTKLIEEAGVVVAPGNGFGDAGEGFVRFSLIEDPPRLVEAAERIGRLLRRVAA